MKAHLLTARMTTFTFLQRISSSNSLVEVVHNQPMDSAKEVLADVAFSLALVVEEDKEVRAVRAGI